MDTENLINTASKVMEIFPDVYQDGLQPTLKESSKIVARIPRAINAALAGIDIWIAKREYKVDETKKLLAIKLENISPDNIVPPEPYVVVPAFQAISYSMDSDKLREMYANLLAKAMIIDEKDKVHPGFVEIIKQMSPIDAENLVFFRSGESLSVAEYRMKNKHGRYITMLRNVFLTNHNQKDILSQATSLSVLEHLGLIKIEYDSYLSSDVLYKPYEETDYYKNLLSSVQSAPINEQEDSSILKPTIQKGMTYATPYGMGFISVCL